MTHHNESEQAFDGLLHYMAQKVPYIQQLKDQLDVIVAKQESNTLAENDVTAATEQLENAEEETKETQTEMKPVSSENKKDYSFLQSKYVFAAFVLSKLSDKDLNFIKQEQKGLARMLENDESSFYGQLASFNVTEEETKEEDVTKIEHKQTLMMFMGSKDDNLLLQMGSLFNSVIGTTCISSNLKHKVPELFGQYQPPPTNE